MEIENKIWKRISIFLIRYPIYKSAKILRPALLVVPRVIEKQSEVNCYVLYLELIIDIFPIYKIIFKIKNIYLYFKIIKALLVLIHFYIILLIAFFTNYKIKFQFFKIVIYELIVSPLDDMFPHFG